MSGLDLLHFLLKDEAHKYFESADFENLEFMSYAPMVREEFKSHFRQSHTLMASRLQTVTEDSHQFFHDLLKTFSKYSDINVLLNTSFNIRGNLSSLLLRMLYMSLTTLNLTVLSLMIPW